MLPGGVRLAALGGSLYYVITGVSLLAVAVLLWRGHRFSLPLFGAVLLGTLVWAVWEVGLDFWALVPRLGLLTLLGLLLLLPSARRRASAADAVAPGWTRAWGVFVAISMAAVVTLSLLRTVDSSDPPIAVDSMRPSAVAGEEAGDWPAYGNTLAGTRFSPLTQIKRENVAKLQVAWRYRFGEEAPNGLQVTPLKIGRTVYACSASNRIVALDAETGVERWLFDPDVDRSAPFPRCRGVAYYRIPQRTGECAERIYTSTVDARVFALDAQTGKPCSDFGENGAVSMLEGLGEHPAGYYFFNAAPTLARGKLVLGGAVVDNQKWEEPSGVIRAIDAVSGALVWAYDVAHPDRIGAPPTGETYTHSTPNSWAQMSFDEALGLIYVPTGNATPDYYGAQRRPYDDEISSAIMALDIETGRRRWVVRTVHHDVWDYDVGSQPVLVDVVTESGVENALIQPTKRGELFMLDRATGEPLAEIVEREVSVPGAAPGERLSPTQPFAVGMPSFAGDLLTETSMWGLTPYDQLWCRIRFRQARYEGPMTPPGLTPSITYPGYLGGMDWGSVSVDLDRSLLIVPTSYVANYTRLVSREEADASGAFAMGYGRDGVEALSGIQSQSGTPFGVVTNAFLSPLVIPCNQPPWGRVHAVDLRTRELLWSRPLGTGRETGPFGVRTGLPIPIGVPLLGGALVTRAGLTFMAATIDRTFRAIDTMSGKIVWSVDLPESGIATPMTYLSPESGRQFVVIAAGGHQVLMTETNDELVAFALPRDALE
jgi:quinoprotein glucose dehydrogenase